MEEKSLQSYWDKIYGKKEIELLGWYEEIPEQSLKLINRCGLKNNARILNVGTGASTLIDKLLEQGYNNIIASDISNTSMEKLKLRIGESMSNKISWIVDDLTNPKELIKLDGVDLWHDRAVLHFFTESQDQDAYFNLLDKVVVTGGYVIIAVFNPKGATMCSGLPVVRYNSDDIANKLGSNYLLLEKFNYTYTMPSGDTREYIYTLFKKESN